MLFNAATLMEIATEVAKSTRVPADVLAVESCEGRNSDETDWELEEWLKEFRRKRKAA